MIRDSKGRFIPKAEIKQTKEYKTNDGVEAIFLVILLPLVLYMLYWLAFKAIHEPLYIPVKIISS